MNSISLDIRRQSASLLVFDMLLPILFFVSALRGLFLTDWVMGKTWSMPLHYLVTMTLLAFLAFLFYWYLPKIDIDVRPTFFIAPILIWLVTTSFIPLEPIFKSGALENLTERTLGYLLAIPYGFVYVRYLQLSRTLGGKICSALFAFLFLFWGFAAAIMGERSLF